MSDQDDDFESEESEEELAAEFPPPERKIFTQAYDLSIATLVEQWDQDLLIVPAIQREYVWDRGRASRLMESLMLNIPVPPVFFSETAEAQYEIIDGHQRIQSIVSYIKNEFALSGLRLQGEYLRKRFHQLPAREQRFLLTRVLRAVIISAESHPQMKFEIFQRLNTGAIALNAQEVRNGIASGPLNDRLHELAQLASFRDCIGSKSPRKRMVDEELVLRFVALHSGLEKYRPPLRRTLNNYMDTNRKMGQARLTALTESFGAACHFMSAVFGESSFRIIDRRNHPTERNINRALYDAQMVPCGWITNMNLAIGLKSSIIPAASVLMKTEEFDDTIRLATGDRKRTMTRIKLWAEMLQNVGVRIDIPQFVRDFDPND